ncbi:MAG: diheme cytochrome c [Deltaproteobacteria bacterium]|nr:diheme cytochrome c [Deltaproteobacteria bacterium]
MKIKFGVLILAVFVLSIMTHRNAFGDEKDRWYKGKKGGGSNNSGELFSMGKIAERHEGDKGGERYLPVVDNVMYKQECSSCHFLYQPGLLPASSWQIIMKNSERHFGENLSLDEKTTNEILSYLNANSADKSKNKRSYKIMNSIGSSSPTRITEVPYIVDKHREIKPNVYKRQAIGSFANCGACHKTADKGDFGDSNVVIPK